RRAALPRQTAAVLGWIADVARTGAAHLIDLARRVVRRTHGARYAAAVLTHIAEIARRAGAAHDAGVARRVIRRTTLTRNAGAGLVGVADAAGAGAAHVAGVDHGIVRRAGRLRARARLARVARRTRTRSADFAVRAERAVAETARCRRAVRHA